MFSFIGAFGVRAQTGSVVMACLFALITCGVFYPTIRREEDWLAATIGDPYRSYLSCTPRFLPDFRKWCDHETLEIRPVFFLTTLRDGLAFLLAIPLFEAPEHAQDVGWMQTMFSLR